MNESTRVLISVTKKGSRRKTNTKQTTLKEDH